MSNSLKVKKPHVIYPHDNPSVLASKTNRNYNDVWATLEVARREIEDLKKRVKKLEG